MLAFKISPTIIRYRASACYVLGKVEGVKSTFKRVVTVSSLIRMLRIGAPATQRVGYLHTVER